MKSNIRKLRNERQISQTTLADVIGKTQQTISHMENDRNRIPIESLITLSEYFGVSTDYILGIDTEQARSGSIDHQLILSIILYLLEESGKNNLKEQGDFK